MSVTMIFFISIHSYFPKGGVMQQIKFLLEEDEIPTSYYNIQADLPTPMDPVLHPGTKQPVGPQDLQPIFPMGLILQEVTQERFVPIPDDVRRLYQLYRP